MAYLSFKITDTDLFKEFIQIFKQVIEDKGVPKKVRIEAKEKINNLMEKYKTE